MARPSKADKPKVSKTNKGPKASKKPTTKAVSIAGADATLPAHTGNSRPSDHPKARETSFKPGQSGNPNGRPKGARSRLSETLLSALADDFQKHGVDTIRKMREEKPVEYVRTCAALVPKAFDLTDDEDGDGKKIIGVALITRNAIEAIIERGNAEADED